MKKILVYSKVVNVKGSYQDQLDFSDFAKGVYFMQIQTEESTEIKKLIIK